MPDERTGLLAGGIRDEAADDGPVARTVARYSSLDQSHTLDRGRWAYAQTANCAVRRAAFEAVGGFDEGARSGGDADLCFRIVEAGWAIEPRLAASVSHRNRSSLRSLAGQKARHGSGAAWLDRRWPGALPRESRRTLAERGARHLRRAAVALARGDRDRARAELVYPVSAWSFELGRLLPNDPPSGRGSWRALDRWLR